MNTFHKKLLAQIQELAKTPSRSEQSQDYHGTGHHHYRISVPIMNSLAKQWVREHASISTSELLLLLDSLNNAHSYEEKNLVGKIIEGLPRQRSEISPHKLDQWLEQLEGWAEIDSLCQNKFSYKDFLDRWSEWKQLIAKFSKDKNISKRRASIVLLTGPVTYSDDKRLSDLSFETIDTLKYEKHILITKAISWLLRSLVKYHKQAVVDYIEKNKSSLPKIAIRETLVKLTTGKKNKARVK